MKKIIALVFPVLVNLIYGCSRQSGAIESLVPANSSGASDYFSTWNVQGYICSYSSNEDMRKAMNEKNMFNDSLYKNWIGLFPRIREDLIFVMDDSWDIPQNKNGMLNNNYLGSVELNEERFPSFKGTPTERLQELVKAVKARGWRGLGVWICAQEAPVFGKVDSVVYWITRLKVANDAGILYWKVDWGKNNNNYGWRKMLTNLGRKYAPDLIIEHAMNEKFIEISDAYRTYDVENVVAQPITIRRISNLLYYEPENGAKGIINCEDEPYIAAALGCAIGIQRHTFSGNLPNRTKDFVFPPVGRDLKKRMDEVTRGIRWHHIAEPFGVGDDNYSIDTVVLNDYWILEERETWCTWCKGRNPGDTLCESAPARLSRGLPLPEVINPNPNQPFVLSSQYPNGTVAIATIGRGIKRNYFLQRMNIEQKIYNINAPIGIFGDYESLSLRLPFNIEGGKYKVYGQDLAGDKPMDVTKEIIFSGNEVKIPGDVIRRVGLSAATRGDISDPGLVLRFFKK
jgi:hypothetical protein